MTKSLVELKKDFNTRISNLNAVLEKTGYALDAQTANLILNFKEKSLFIPRVIYTKENMIARNPLDHLDDDDFNQIQVSISKNPNTLTTLNDEFAKIIVNINSAIQNLNAKIDEFVDQVLTFIQLRDKLKSDAQAENRDKMKKEIQKFIQQIDDVLIKIPVCYHSKTADKTSSTNVDSFAHQIKALIPKVDQGIRNADMQITNDQLILAHQEEQRRQKENTFKQIKIELEIFLEDFNQVISEIEARFKKENISLKSKKNKNVQILLRLKTELILVDQMLKLSQKIINDPATGTLDFENNLTKLIAPTPFTRPYDIKEIVKNVTARIQTDKTTVLDNLDKGEMKEDVAPKKVTPGLLDFLGDILGYESKVYPEIKEIKDAVANPPVSGDKPESQTDAQPPVASAANLKGTGPVSLKEQPLPLTVKIAVANKKEVEPTLGVQPQPQIQQPEEPGTANKKKVSKARKSIKRNKKANTKNVNFGEIDAKATKPQISKSSKRSRRTGVDKAIPVANLGDQIPHSDVERPKGAEQYSNSKKKSKNKEKKPTVNSPTVEFVRTLESVNPNPDTVKASGREIKTPSLQKPEEIQDSAIDVKPTSQKPGKGQDASVKPNSVKTSVSAIEEKATVRQSGKGQDASVKPKPVKTSVSAIEEKATVRQSEKGQDVAVKPNPVEITVPVIEEKSTVRQLEKGQGAAVKRTPVKTSMPATKEKSPVRKLGNAQDAPVQTNPVAVTIVSAIEEKSPVRKLGETQDVLVKPKPGAVATPDTEIKSPSLQKPGNTKNASVVTNPVAGTQVTGIGGGDPHNYQTSFAYDYAYKPFINRLSTKINNLLTEAGVAKTSDRNSDETKFFKQKVFSPLSDLVASLKDIKLYNQKSDYLNDYCFKQLTHAKKILEKPPGFGEAIWISFKLSVRKLFSRPLTRRDLIDQYRVENNQHLEKAHALIDSHLGNLQVIFELAKVQDHDERQKNQEQEDNARRRLFKNLNQTKKTDKRTQTEPVKTTTHQEMRAKTLLELETLLLACDKAQVDFANILYVKISDKLNANVGPNQNSDVLTIMVTAQLGLLIELAADFKNDAISVPDQKTIKEKLTVSKQDTAREMQSLLLKILSLEINKEKVKLGSMRTLADLEQCQARALQLKTKLEKIESIYAAFNKPTQTSMGNHHNMFRPSLPTSSEPPKTQMKPKSGAGSF